MGKPASPKQIAFIKKLVFEKDAKETSEGTLLNNEVHPEYELDLILEGEIDSFKASKFINLLLSAPNVNVKDGEQPSDKPSSKQLHYAKSLLEQLGKDTEVLDDISRRDISTLIGKLKDEIDGVEPEEEERDVVQDNRYYRDEEPKEDYDDSWGGVADYPDDEEIEDYWSSY